MEVDGIMYDRWHSGVRIQPMIMLKSEEDPPKADAAHWPAPAAWHDLDHLMGILRDPDDPINL